MSEKISAIGDDFCRALVKPINAFLFERFDVLNPLVLRGFVRLAGIYRVGNPSSHAKYNVH